MSGITHSFIFKFSNYLICKLLFIFKLSRLYQKQGLVKLNRAGIVNQYFYYVAAYFAFNFIKELHCLDNANHFTGGYFVAWFNKRWLVRRRTPVKMQGQEHKPEQERLAG